MILGPIYISGPMSGVADSNFPAFHRAARELREAGYIVMNPAELNPEQGLPWATYLRRDIAVLVTCEAIALLPGHEASKGARLEHYIAQHLGMPAHTVQELLEAAE
jgi:hypothetical protein